MIRGEAMREKIKSLWKLCFNDSDEFTDMYFRLRYSNEVNIAIQSGEEVIAALQNTTLSHDIRKERNQDRICVGGLYASRLSQSRGYARTVIASLYPYATQ